LQHAHHHRQARRERAFSLVEILVVVALAAVLAALLIPALTRGTKKAQAVRCTANLRNIGMAITQYAGENSGKLPEALSYGITTGDTMIPALASYLGDIKSAEKVWDCPSNPGLRKIGFTGYVQGNYATAFYFGHPQSGKSAYTLLQVRDFTPDKRWLLADMDGWIYGNANVAKLAPLPVHQGGRNILYVDGRVEWKPSQQGVIP
jgi:prepilin-type N-terminal cleavage/methylation domain-containing protein/prepilin-type processing-associated H-X9-DG protein